MGALNTKFIMKLFIGNLGSDVTADDLLSLFSEFGEVISAHVAESNCDSSPVAYGYIEMSNESDAERAIRAMNKKQLMERYVSVSKALNTNRSA
jgi:RNA recognition motif-containing protein